MFYMLDTDVLVTLTGSSEFASALYRRNKGTELQEFQALSKLPNSLAQQVQTHQLTFHVTAHVSEKLHVSPGLEYQVASAHLQT